MLQRKKLNIKAETRLATFNYSGAKSERLDRNETPGSPWEMKNFHGFFSFWPRLPSA